MRRIPARLHILKLVGSARLALLNALYADTYFPRDRYRSPSNSGIRGSCGGVSNTRGSAEVLLSNTRGPAVVLLIKTVTQ